MRRTVAGLALLALGLTACQGPDVTGPPVDQGPSTTEPGIPSPSPTPDPAAACRTQAAAMSPEQLAHQVLIISVDPGAAELDEVTAGFLGRGVGGVVYLPTTQAPAEQVRRLGDEIRAAAALPPLITVDQEGGQVARLVGPGFTPMPSAADQAELDAAALATRALAWGRELKAAGIDVDLAPVADVVPPAFVAGNEPVAQLGRGYGTDPALVSAKVSAFSRGLHDGGVGTTLKHYPGLGRTTTNTDFGVATDTTTTLADPELQPFRDNAAAADLVMVSLVVYERIDPARPAALSPTVLRAVREDLGFTGPIISDDLGAAVAVQDLAPGERATGFVRAGGDLVITVDPQTWAPMADALAAEAAGDPAFSARLTDAAARVLVLKQERGLLTCR